MSRLFFFLALISLIVLIYRSLAVNKRRIDKPKPKSDPKGNKKILRCDYCDIHVPEDEIISMDGRQYCSEEHARLDHPRE